LNTTPNHARRLPRLHIDTGDILTHIASAQAASCQECGAGTAELTADIVRLLAEITWLYESFRETRLRAANLEAALLAALHAREDGDDDPIGYLRDEITPHLGVAYGP
jgi:hypothetical protein